MSTGPQRERSDTHKVCERCQNSHSATTRVSYLTRTKCREGCAISKFITIRIAPQREQSDTHKVPGWLRERCQNSHRATTKTIRQAQRHERVVPGQVRAFHRTRACAHHETRTLTKKLVAELPGKVWVVIFFKQTFQTSPIQAVERLIFTTGFEITSILLAERFFFKRRCTCADDLNAI